MKGTSQHVDQSPVAKAYTTHHAAQIFQVDCTKRNFSALISLRIIVIRGNVSTYRPQQNELDLSVLNPNIQTNGSISNVRQMHNVQYIDSYEWGNCSTL
jgi:hypothetical protein